MTPLQFFALAALFEDMQVKLVCVTIVFPAVKAALSSFLIFLPYTRFFMESILFSVLFSEIGVDSSSSSSSRQNVPLDQLVSSYIYPSRLWPFLLIYVHFVIVVGSSFCHFHCAFMLLTRRSLLVPSQVTTMELNSKVIISSISLIFNLMPFGFVDNEPVVSVLCAAQIGMELGIFQQLHQLLDLIREAAQVAHLDGHDHLLLQQFYHHYYEDAPTTDNNLDDNNNVIEH